MTHAEAIDCLRYHAHSQTCTLTPRQCGELADALEFDDGPHLPGDVEAMSAYELRFRLMSSRAAVDNLHAQLAKAIEAERSACHAAVCLIGTAEGGDVDTVVACAQAIERRGTLGPVGPLEKSTVEASVAAEREACAQAAEAAEGGYPTGASAAIRARGGVTNVALLRWRKTSENPTNGKSVVGAFGGFFDVVNQESDGSWSRMGEWPLGDDGPSHWTTKEEAAAILGLPLKDTE